MSQRTKKRYTREFKESSAKLAIDSDQSLSQTALDLGVNKVTLSTWVKKYASKTKSGSPHGGKSVEAELHELRKENARLKQERDILKKAAAYFASEM
jgi:transposase